MVHTDKLDYIPALKAVKITDMMTIRMCIGLIQDLIVQI